MLGKLSRLSNRQPGVLARNDWQKRASDYTAKNVADDPNENTSTISGSETESTPPEAAVDAPSPLEVALSEAARLKDQLLRTAADFDNFRKRSRRETADAERKGRDDLLKELLPVFDNLERATALGTAADGSDLRGILDGIELVMRQFRDTLGRLGVERIVAIGQPFDPALHEAIQHLETADFAPGCVAAEVQSGYRQGERVIRPALVVVAKPPSPADAVNEGPTA